MGTKFRIAILISLVLMLISNIPVSAGHSNQDLAPHINLFTALLVGTLYYLAASPWLANLGFTVMYRPLIAGTLVGIIMGRPSEGIAMGANINVLYLGWIGAGGNLPSDPALAGYLGTALALSGGLDAKAALALAAPLGLLGSLVYSVRMSASTILAHWADKAAERADIQAVARINYLYGQPFLYIIYAIPVALAAYLGAPVVAQALNWMTQNAAWVLEGLFIASGMLAALGIGLNMKFLFQRAVWPYFLIGFVLASTIVTMESLLPLTVIGLCLAFLHVHFSENIPPAETPEEHPKEKPLGILTKNDLFRAWVRWLFFSHAAYNWERMQGLGFAHSMTPIIQKLYKDPAEISAALKRHLIFFNTQPDIGGIIHGIVIAMEEERATGVKISDGAINAVKSGLMGPLAGIGDTLQQGLLIPIALATAMNIATGGNLGIATQGNILGPLLYAMISAAYAWGFGWFVWWQGYQQGRAAVVNLLKGGKLNRVITGAGVLGNFIIGALAVDFVSLTTPLAIKIGADFIHIQPLLDSLFPNLLPLLLILLIWWLLTKKNVSPLIIMGALITLGILGAYPLWPGVDLETGKILQVSLFGS